MLLDSWKQQSYETWLGVIFLEALKHEQLELFDI